MLPNTLNHQHPSKDEQEIACSKYACIRIITNVYIGDIITNNAHDPCKELKLDHGST